MTMHDTEGHYSETLHFANNMPASPESLRKAFSIPMHGTTRTVIGGTTSSTARILMEEEKRD